MIPLLPQLSTVRTWKLQPPYSYDLEAIHDKRVFPRPA